MKMLVASCLVLSGSVLVPMVAGAVLGTPTTSLESVSTSGDQGNLYSYAIGIGAHGRYVVFNSDATNLVAGDSNNRGDVFVRDRLTGETTRVSISSSGKQASPSSDPFGGSHASGMSADGRYVVFVSDASNLVRRDTNGTGDVFVHDRLRGETTRVSVSGTGRQANGPSGAPAISAGGRYVAFVSSASNLVAGDTNRKSDVYVHDRQTGRTQRVSLSNAGRQANGHCEGPAISVHGRYVAFVSSASNLVAGDTNGLADIFVRYLRTGQTRRVSVSSRGRQSTGSPTQTGSNAPTISADGRYVAFHSDASNLVPGDTNGTFDIFVRDRVTGKTRRVSVGNGGEEANAETLGRGLISGDGRYVAFASLASNLVANDLNDITDVFIRDRRTQRTMLVSLSSTGEQGNDGSWPAAMSVDNRYLVFSSWAGNLVPNDASPGPDVFVRDFAGAPN